MKNPLCHDFALTWAEVSERSMIAAEICEADGASDERAEDQQMEVEDAKILQVAAVT